jgi:outer membrane protein assembly factor BamB
MANWNIKCNAASGGFELSVPAYHDGIVYVASSSSSAGNGSGRVNAIYANNGTIREYAYYGLSGFQLNTPVTYADGKIYLGNSKIPNDNCTYWNRTAPHPTGYYWAGAAIVGDYIIYGDDTANVTCLNKDTGAFVDYINVSEQCGVTPVEEIRSSIVWNENTGRIYFTGKKQSPCSGHTYAVAFNSTTGDLGGDGAEGGGNCEWVTDIDYTTSTPVVYGDKVYVCMGGMYGGDAKVLKCLDEVYGNILYTYDIPDGASQASPAVSVFGGHVYIYFTTNMYNGSTYCVEDTGTGFNEKWVWNPPDDQYILQGMAISDGMVYFGTDAGYVYALKSGLEQFEIPIYSGKNLIAIPLVQDDPTLNAVFGDDPVDLDKVRRYIPGVGYKTATYWSGNWVGFVSDVEPIEPEVGYEYEREDADYVLTVLGTRCTGTISTPIYNGKNLIGYVSFTETDISTFNSPVDLDKVRRYIPGVGYKTATYWSGGWVGFVSDVEPIEPSVGYEYERAGVQYGWIYEA